MNNPAAKWNLFDSFLYKIESVFTKLVSELKKDENTLPDPEEMITAATKYLKEENDHLKKKEYPGTLKIKNGKYFCPDCRTEIPTLIIKECHTKYCPECGKRIMLTTPYHYATSHRNMSLGEGTTNARK